MRSQVTLTKHQGACDDMDAAHKLSAPSHVWFPAGQRHAGMPSCGAVSSQAADKVRSVLLQLPLAQLASPIHASLCASQMLFNNAGQPAAGCPHQTARSPL